MRNGKSFFILFTLLLVIGLVLAACSNDSGGSDAGDDSGDKTGKQNKELASKQVLNFVSSSDLPNIDPSTATDVTSFGVINRTHVGLISIEKKKAIPDMAEAMPEVNKDKTVYTFKIRDDAKWSNGDPVTASDFVFSWRRVLKPETASQYAYIMDAANIKNAVEIMDKQSDLYGKVEKLGVKALDDKTLQVTLEEPTPFFISLMSFVTFAPLNEDFVKEQGNKFAKEPKNMLSNGPYILSGWKHGSSWTLTKNDKYWNAEKVNITEANYKVVKSQNTQLNLYKSDDIQMDGLSAEQVNAYKDKPEFHSIPGNGIFWWKLNVKTVPEFKNEKIRKAMSMVINRENAVKVLLNNGSIAAQYAVPKDFATGPDGKDFREGVEDYLPGGVEEAKKLWQEAKKEEGIDTLELEYLTTDSDVAGELAEYFANQLEKLEGMKVTIKKLPWNAYLETDTNGNYDIGAGAGWFPDYKDPMTFLGYWYSDNPNNTTGMEIDDYDKLIEKARSLGAKPKERWKVLKEAEKVLIENAYAIPTYQSGSATLVKSYVEDIVFQNYGYSTYYREAKIYQH
ncbi:peptide ABC transporter substrate-binding protein [Virgibacillus siamensis]|uniref:peptide ABC transporter substrate-binding protein n=1 Tax=Virgibacillus siamensis TaxID=480071 RepID=UPI000987C3B3|nr:peptide ABC transporter substrate-binding protein [Virgibacillus siamensis]